MRNAKFMLVFALAGVLCVSGLAACGSKKPAETKAASTTEAVKTEAATEAAEAEAVTSEAAETKASAAEGCDLEAVFQGVIDKQENADNAESMKMRLRLMENMDQINGLYIGIADIDLAQIKYYAPPISGNPCEIMMVEVKNADDVKKVQDIFQATIDSFVKGGACDAEMGAVWEKNAQIQTSGNLVAMIVLPDGYTIPENIFE